MVIEALGMESVIGVDLHDENYSPAHTENRENLQNNEYEVEKYMPGDNMSKP